MGSTATHEQGRRLVPGAARAKLEASRLTVPSQVKSNTQSRARPPITMIPIWLFMYGVDISFCFSSPGHEWLTPPYVFVPSSLLSPPFSHHLLQNSVWENFITASPHLDLGRCLAECESRESILPRREGQGKVVEGEEAKERGGSLACKARQEIVWRWWSWKAFTCRVGHWSSASTSPCMVTSCPVCSVGISRLVAARGW